MKDVAPLPAGHFTYNRVWLKITNRVSKEIQIALHPRVPLELREKYKVRCRKNIQLQATFRKNAAFDARAKDIAEKRRFALAAAPKGGALRSLMN